MDGDGGGWNSEGDAMTPNELAMEKCPACDGTGAHHSKDFPSDAPEEVGTNSLCETCYGTKLRYPELSVQCPHAAWREELQCAACGVEGDTSDSTLATAIEKGERHG